MVVQTWNEGKDSYTCFANNLLPQIKNLAVDVNSFFAASSCYGTPDEFEYLVDKAHSLELYIRQLTM